MYRLISCCLLLLLAGCVSKNGFDRDDGESPGGDPVSVAYLKSLYRGYPLRVTDDVELRVVVTANDAYGAFRNTLVVQDATGGIEVKVGGRDVREYDLQALRDAVAVVLQKNVLFSGTIKDNLRWGNKNATDEELIHACKLAQADEFVTQFPAGYDTYIEQGGTNVSGGQKQRLCIARALLKKPKILILDDSTSAVDTKTDALIRQAFKNELPDTTKIIIAQRVSSVQDADRILVMDGGRIVESGTHEELLALNGIYREVNDSQTKTE